MQQKCVFNVDMRTIQVKLVCESTQSTSTLAFFISLSMGSFNWNLSIEKSVVEWFGVLNYGAESRGTESSFSYPALGKLNQAVNEFLLHIGDG